MKRLHSRPLLSLILLFILCVCISCSIFESDIRKARKFIEEGNYLQAIELLEQEVSENPESAEGYYLMGICYLHLEQFKKADAKFKKAVSINMDYTFKIAEVCMDAGIEALNSGEPKIARDLFMIAMVYDPSLMERIIKLTEDAGWITSK